MAKYKYELTIKLDRNSPQRLRKHLAEAGFMITVAGTASNEPMVLNNSFKTGSIVYMNFDEDFEYSCVYNDSKEPPESILKELEEAEVLEYQYRKKKL